LKSNELMEMFEVVKIRDTVRVPPEKFGKKMKESLVNITQEEYEGLIDEDLGIIVAVTSAEKTGEGKVVPGDGAAYYETDIGLLVFKPKMHELVEAKVSEITEFGAFVGVGPMEGLVHVSQIIDEGYSIGDVIGMLWLRKKMPKYASNFIELVIKIVADHGPCVSGAHNARVASRAGKDLVSSLASGLLTIGPRFGGAIDDAAKYINRGNSAFTSSGIMASQP